MTQPILRFIDTQVSAQCQDTGRVEVIAGTSNRARDGHVVDMKGMDYGAFLRSGTILWNHNSDCPIGRPYSCNVDAGGNLRVGIEFAPEGASAKADEIRALVKAGIVRNLSVGFHPLEMKPLDPQKPKAGNWIVRSELWELSFCSVPVDPGAVVTARQSPNGTRTLADGTVMSEEKYQEWQHRRRQAAALEMQMTQSDLEWAELERTGKLIRY